MKNVLFLVLVLVLLAGCAGPTTTIETEDGKATVTVSGMDESWCPEGGSWDFQGTTDEGAATASWKIDKLMTSGEYEGLCHVVYTAEGPEGSIKMDYYFSEDGESGYVEMNINGQKISQEWSK